MNQKHFDLDIFGELFQTKAIQNQDNEKNKYKDNKSYSSKGMNAR